MNVGIPMKTYSAALGIDVRFRVHENLHSLGVVTARDGSVKSGGPAVVLFNQTGKETTQGSPIEHKFKRRDHQT